MFKLDELFSELLPPSPLLTEDARMACKAHVGPWIQVACMSELGLRTLCASCRFGSVCNR